MTAVNFRCFFLLIITILSVSAMSSNTILPPGKDPGIRCNSEELSQQECDEDRRDAIIEGCLNQNELDIIKSYNGCPVCKKGRYKGWCPVGCFVRGTKLLVWDSQTKMRAWVPVEDIVYNSSQYKVFALDKNSSSSYLQFVELPIRLTVLGPERKPLVVLTTQNQVVLGLSSEHTVVLSDGTLVKAELLRVGDTLVGTDGTPEVIADIERSMTDDDVFNLSVDSDIDQSHLIIAEGLLVGDQFLQGSALLGTQILK